MKKYKDFVSALIERKGKKIKVPKFKKSRDAEKFLDSLGLDDVPNADVIDPETGEVLFDPNNKNSNRSKRKRLKARGKRDIADKEEDKEWDYPDIFFDDYNDPRAEQEMAVAYNIVFKEMKKLVNKGDLEMLAKADYDVGWRIPKALARKDGKKFIEQDVENVERFVEYWSDRMGNIKLHSSRIKTGVKRVQFDFSFT